MNSMDMPTNSGHPVSPINRNTLDEYIEEMGESGKDSLSRLIDVFLSTSPKILGDIQLALSNLDYQKLNRAFHSLKSSSAIVGADRLSALCLDLEQQTRYVLQSGSAPESELQSTILTVGEQVVGEFGDVCIALEQVKRELLT